MIYCIIGRNGVCNNDFSSGCYKCCMALCYDDSREVMGLQECVRQAMELISALQKESVSPAVFLKQHVSFFSGIPLWSLLAPECRQKAVYTESSYVYLIGSYLYFQWEGKPVTWLERRRFAVFPSHSEFYQKTLCSNWKRRFQTLQELQEYLLQMPS